MTKPTTDDIRAWSNLDFNRLGYSDEDKLAVMIDRAVGYVTMVTGIQLANAEAAVVWNSPATAQDIHALMGQAIQMRVEQAILQSRPDYVESAAENDVIQSFSAGLYSESRRDPYRQQKSQSINTWPALDELLWQLMSPDAYAYWVYYTTGAVMPDMSVVGVNWNPYDYGSSLSWYEPWDTIINTAETF